MADKPAPKVGHFLPGGEGDAAGQTSPPAQAGGSAPLAAPTPRLGGEAPPTPPQLTASRIQSRRTTTSGTRLGPPPPDDPAAAAYRAVFHPDPIPFVPKKRSKAVVAAIVVGALVLVAGGVA